MGVDEEGKDRKLTVRQQLQANKQRSPNVQQITRLPGLSNNCIDTGMANDRASPALTCRLGLSNKTMGEIALLFGGNSTVLGRSLNNKYIQSVANITMQRRSIPKKSVANRPG